MTDYISTAEAAERLGVTVQRVRKLISEGRITARKIGRTHIVDPASVAAFKPRPEGRPGHRTGGEQP